MSKSSQPVSIADTALGAILARIEISAPPERVFRALTTKELTEWWGSAETYRFTSFEIDLRPGGWWREEGVGADGKPFHVGGTVLEVDPPRRLVETREPSSDDEGPPTTMTYLLEPIRIGTRVTSATPDSERAWRRARAMRAAGKPFWGGSRTMSHRDLRCAISFVAFCHPAGHSCRT